MGKVNRHLKLFNTSMKKSECSKISRKIWKKHVCITMEDQKAAKVVERSEKRKSLKKTNGEESPAHRHHHPLMLQSNQMNQKVKFIHPRKTEENPLLHLE